MSRKALRLIRRYNLNPVLLGARGDDLKRPQLRNWQNDVYTEEDVADWPARNNVGIRCGEQRDGRFLLVWDFDYEADDVYPRWKEKAAAIVGHDDFVEVTSGKGKHVYFYVPSDTSSETFAGRYVTGEDGKNKLEKFIETIGTTKQIVTPGSRHPSGRKYRFASKARFKAIPELNEEQYQALVKLSESFDEREETKPEKTQKMATGSPSYKTIDQPVATFAGDLAGINDCLDYARRFISGQEKVASKAGDIRFLGHGGFMVTNDGKAWYNHSYEVGGNLIDLIAWHRNISKADVYAMLRPIVSTEAETKNVDSVINIGSQYLREANLEFPDRCIIDANTGVGKNYYACTTKGKVIVVFSTILAIQQQAKQFPRATVWYELEQTITPSSELILTTYDSLANVVAKLNEWEVDISKFGIYVDEFHNFALSGFRRKALEGVLEVISDSVWRFVRFFSGTPEEVRHSALESYELVKVESERRVQNATMVQWKRIIEPEDGEDVEEGEEEYEGRMVDTAVALKHRHDRVVYYLNDKKGGKDRLIAALIASGVRKKNIYCLNADNKYEALGQQLAEHETVPVDCKVLIVTNVFVESANLRTHFDAAVIMSRVHPAYTQQLVNRKRGEEPMDMVYVLTSGRGEGFRFDVDKAYEHELKLAKIAVEHLNFYEEVHGRIDDREFKTFRTSLARHVKRGDDGKFVIDELAVAQGVHDQAKEYANNNPEAYKTMTAKYNWQWLADEEIVITEDDKEEGQVALEQELKEEYKDLAEATRRERLAYIYKLGPQGTENLVFAGQRNTVLNEAKRALEIADEFGDERWNDVMALLAGSTGSDQSFAQIIKTKNADYLVQSGNKFARALVDTFEVGGFYTKDERFLRLMQVYSKTWASIEAEPIALRYWSEDAEVPTTPDKADEILRRFFTLKHRRKQVDGVRTSGLEVIDTEPLFTMIDEGREKLAEAVAEYEAKYKDAAPASVVTKVQVLVDAIDIDIDSLDGLEDWAGPAEYIVSNEGKPPVLSEQAQPKMATGTPFYKTIGQPVATLETEKDAESPLEDLPDSDDLFGKEDGEPLVEEIAGGAVKRVSGNGEVPDIFLA